MVVAIELGNDLGIERQRRFIFAGLRFLERIGQAVLDQYFLSFSVEDEQVEAGELMRIGPDGSHPTDKLFLARCDTESGSRTVLIQSQTHHRVEMMLEMAGPMF